MIKHILVPTDGSELSTKAVKEAINFARDLGANLTALHVVGQYHPPFLKGGYKMPEIHVMLKQRFEEQSAARANQIMADVKEIAAEHRVKCSCVLAKNDSPYDAIIRQARKSKCDLIMMASHGRRGLDAILLGSETTKVLTHSKIPVLVVR